MPQQARYSVIDLETTGLRPARGHRVLEIGVVQLNELHAPVNSWETLVNPHRRVTASQIHGITQAMVDNAPSFDGILGEFVSLLDGTTVVAHNARFELRFLESELRRCGVIAFGRPLCTADLAIEGGMPRSLAACCEHLRIARGQPHRALRDAEATAAVFQLLARRATVASEPWTLSHGQRLHTGRVWTREDAANSST